jgi:hypothetical protein
LYFIFALCERKNEMQNEKGGTLLRQANEHLRARLPNNMQMAPNTDMSDL